MKPRLILVHASLSLSLTLLSISSPGTVMSTQIEHVESIRDRVFQDILTQMNLTSDKIVKDERLNLYRIYLNETGADEHGKCGDEISALKFVNKTHMCYVLGDKNNLLFDEISAAVNRDKESFDNIYLEDLYSVKNISEIVDKVEAESGDSETDTGSKSQPKFRSLASFHELNNNEINYRRNYLKRRYFDEVDEKNLSKTERKRRKKRRKKLKKREKELREKRKKYKSPLDKLRSTIKWMACVEISLAICGCCLNLVQAVVIPFISPIPFGSIVQPVSGQIPRGFEDYGYYRGPPANFGSMIAHQNCCPNNYRCNGGAGGGVRNFMRGENGNLISNNILQGLQQLRGNRNP